jgi:hypothetical protein
MINKTLLSFALVSAGVLAANAAHASTGVSARSLYQPLSGPNSEFDISKRDYDFATTTEVSSNLAQVIDGGSRNAAAWASLDPRTGAFKIRTDVATAAAAPTGGLTVAEASAGLSDKIRVNSAAATAELEFTVRYNSAFNDAPVSTAGGWDAPHFAFRETLSAFSVRASHTVINPNPCSECSFSYEETLGEQSGRASTYAFYKAPHEYNGYNVAYQGVQQFEGSARNDYIDVPHELGNWNGTLTFSIVVPTNEDISLSTNFEATSFCDHSLSCTSTNDSSHSFYLGLKAVGGALESQNGYGYTLGVSAVPEPETYGMLLAGLGLLGVAARRKKSA